MAPFFLKDKSPYFLKIEIFNTKSIGIIKSRIRIFLTTIFLITIYSLQGQDYRAIHGSSWAGSLAVANNPSSIVYAPFTWDFTPLAFQFKQSTNAIIINNISYLPPWKKADLKSSNGTFKRFLFANQDMRLLNARIRLNSNSAIAFGLSMREYLSVKTSKLNMQDTIDRLREFMGINTTNIPASAEGRGNMWAEIFGTYARTILMPANAIINAGITVKVNYGGAGGYLTASGLDEVPGLVNNKPGYYLTNGNLKYGYSSNLDVFDSALTFAGGTKDFLRKIIPTIGISLGAEYIIPADIGGDASGYGYSLKIGVSLLDLGYNKFHYSNYSRSAILNKNNVSDSLIDFFFANIVDAASVADSLQNIAGSTNAFQGNFKLYQPGRLVINIDKHIIDNFFINGELTLPLTSVLEKKQLIARDMNLISLTPRYETKAFGIYFPVSLNTQMKYWIGGAIKTGPFLLGFHNLANIFGKNKIQEGGAYLAFTFRFGGKDENITDRVSGQKISVRQSKQLRCPTRVQ